jgi:hypothetical protein
VGDGREAILFGLSKAVINGNVSGSSLESITIGHIVAQDIFLPPVNGGGGTTG